MVEKYPEYKEFKKYKKSKDVTSKNVLTVFVTTFLIMLVFFIGAAKRISPDVDVTIGEDQEIEKKESGLGVKGFIDDRLKAIQSEDTISESEKRKNNIKKSETEEDEISEDKYFSKELEQKVKIPAKTESKENNSKITDKKESNHNESGVNKEEQSPKQTVSLPAHNTITKVVVGNYSSIDQAKVAQSILQESGLGVTPFIKNIHGSYTLQVGSFSSEEKAQSLANELLRNNFPAKIIKE